MTGPYTSVPLGNGQEIDLYLLEFGKSGRLTSPEALASLEERLPGHSDVFFFSHGWNNPFGSAMEKYTTFIQGYAAQRDRLDLPAPEGYRPLLVGAIWPSTGFLFPGEHGPDIAATDPAADEQEEMLRLLRDELDPQQYADLARCLHGTEPLSVEDAKDVAEVLLAELAPGDEHEIPPEEDDVLTPEDVVGGTWVLQNLEAPTPAPGADDFGSVASPDDRAAALPEVAGGSRLDPRWLLRMATVWTMKDRAGKVGAHGVAPVLQHLLDESDARVHLVGHSFGARVVLSAAVTQRARRNVHSMLLLQPAVNRWCFADKVVDRDVAGGYRPVLDKVDLPVLTTFSRHDTPLHDTFHFAVRGASLGEIQAAALGSPEKYGALGGYGPAGVESRTTLREAVPEGTSYQLDDVPAGHLVQIDGDVSGVKVPGVDAGSGSPAISGHGDINTTVTWWLLHTLTAPDPAG